MCWKPCLTYGTPWCLIAQQYACPVFSTAVLGRTPTAVLVALLPVLQAPFYGMHPGQLLSRKLSQHTSQLLHFPPSTPACLVQLCLDCWADEPARRPSMAAVVQRINDLAVTLLGQQQAVAMFPDVAASLAAQRRQAAMAAVAVAGDAGGSS
jgi:hypothetical protein